ncbi:MAG TPA: hypothetical protein VEW07_11445 [Solirubrobacterales bacterium]|nr:hypothetical protein [Solirubrobacterales bacterium]
MRQYILATTPGGKTYRWGEDEAGPDRVFEDLQDSDSIPGGYKELSCSLARKPGVDYGDMQGGTKIELFSAGQYKVWEGALHDAPRTSGDRLVISPAAVGYQSHLSDDESAQCIPIDADMAAWGEASARRRAEDPVPTDKFTNASVQLLPAGTPSAAEPKSFLASPAISHAWSEISSKSGRDLAESWYDSQGVEIGEVLLDFVNAKGLNSKWANRLFAARDDVGLVAEELKNFAGSSAANQAFAVAAARCFLVLQDQFNEALEERGSWEAQWQNVRVRDRSRLPLYGSWPNVGVLASDVTAYALSRWAPLLSFSTGPYGSIRPSNLPISHLPFKEPTTVQDIVEKANRFELNEWAVWSGQFGPTFYMNPKGEREGRKCWRGRVGPTQLRETGQSMKRAINGLLIQYQDVDGSTRVIAPTGSGYPLTSDRLLDTDPLNPANQIPGLRKWPKISMKRVATQRGAEETAARLLEQAKMLDGSGEATLTGYVEDEHGAEYPYYHVKSGDLFDPIDSSNPGYRYIVSANRGRSSRSNAIALDAPPDSYEALLECLDVEEIGIG